MVDVIAGLAVLLMLLALIVGIIALFNPKWFGFKSRGKSSATFFGSAVGLFLVIGIAFPPSENVEQSDLKERETAAASSSPGLNDTPESPPQSRSEPTHEHDFVYLQPLLYSFGNQTKIQQEHWNRENEWKHWVQGGCIVAEVKRTGMLSQIRRTAYEVVCEMSSGDRAILFYGSDAESFIMNLQAGSHLNFQGNLKSIEDWGFWRSGYIRVTD